MGNRHHPRRQRRSKAVEGYTVPDLQRLMLSIGRPGTLDPDAQKVAVHLFGQISGLIPETEEEYDFLVAGLERFADEIDAGVSVEESLQRLMTQDGQSRG